MLRPATSILALLALCLWGSAGGALAQPPAGLDEIPPLELPTPDEGNGGFGDVGDEIPDLGDAPSEELPEPLDNGARASDDVQSVLDSAEPEQLFDGYGSQYEHDDEILVDYLAPIYSSGEWLDCGRWRANLDFVLMHRTVGRGAVLGQEPLANAVGGQAAVRPLVTDNAGFRIEPGGRFRIGKFMARDSWNRDAILEFEYLGMFDWQTGAQLNAVSNVGILTALDPFFDPQGFTPTIGGFNNSSVQRFRYSSDMNSFEINARLQHRLGRDRMVAMPDGTWSRQLASGLVPSYFMGLRYLRTQENLTWTSRRDGLSLDEFRGDYFVDTTNDLVGVHVGGNLRMQFKNWNGTVRGKVGSHVNFGDVQRFILSNDPTPGRVVFNPPFRNEQIDEVMAVALELGFRSAYHINPHLTLRMSYDMLWINGLALATDQLTFEASRARIDLGGNVFYQGLTTGIELIW